MRVVPPLGTEVSSTQVYDGTSPSFTALEVGVTPKCLRFGRIQLLALDSFGTPFPVSWIRHC